MTKIVEILNFHTVMNSNNENNILRNKNNSNKEKIFSYSTPGNDSEINRNIKDKNKVNQMNSCVKN